MSTVKKAVPRKLTPTEKSKARAAITSYSQVAIDHRLNRGYSQRRAVVGYGKDPDDVQIDDCSGFESKLIYWVNHKLRIYLSDPLGEHFTGWGNTETIQETMKHATPEGKYLVGDCALWGPNNWDTHHTAICFRKGDKKTALFCSHGHQSWRYSEDAPEAIKLAYFPQHLIGVYRLPELL